jgi:hypothetical protein
LARLDTTIGNAASGIAATPEPPAAGLFSFFCCATPGVMWTSKVWPFLAMVTPNSAGR